ncbi:hypothetical protein [Escherichia coli]|uniref:hypothetical protein n=1 Tax=Escherichia coli TaxID=562 RepID=UPI003F549F36
MDKFKGTPGPWDYDTALDAIFNKSCLFICDVSDKENARLIAAAPELLEALQDFMSASSGNTQSCGHDFECICRFDKAKAAIAKALGK